MVSLSFERLFQLVYISGESEFVTWRQNRSTWRSAACGSVERDFVLSTAFDRLEPKVSCAPEGTVSDGFDGSG